MRFYTRHAYLTDLFQEWELRVCILLSLFLQIFLIVTGTFRRLASHQWIVILLWLAYLLADVVAVFGLGLIGSRQSLFSKYCAYVRDKAGRGCFSNHLHIYWAPFLLVHLGGPDIITAFAPEDNELWPRHLFYLGSQCIAVSYTFYQSLGSNHQLRIPTIVMLLCGIIKCMERTYALYHGSAKSFRNSMLFKPADQVHITVKPLIETIDRDPPLAHLEILRYAFLYFTAFKGLVVDLKVSIRERNLSRDFFLATSCTHAFRLVEVELNYLYDVLFTKASVLHNKLGYFFRTLSFISVVASFVVFHFVIRKELYLPLDIKITYILLIGAVVLDVISFFMLLFSDWTILKLMPVYFTNFHHKLWKDKFAYCIFRVNYARGLFLDRLLGCVGERKSHTLEFMDSRWAQSLSTFNLISYCLRRRSKGREKIYHHIGLLSYLHRILYVKSKPLTKHIRELVFGQLKLKSEKASTLALAKEICSSKGEWILKFEEQGSLLPFVNNYNYDDILVIWNIATELCYHDNQDDQPSSSILEQRDTAKQLSDYMLYLMVMQADMMSAVSSIGEKKFRDTCNEVSKFFDTKLPEPKKRKFNFFRRENQTELNDNTHKKACDMILSIYGEVMLNTTTQSDENVLYTASKLATKLNVIPPEKRWLTISKFWVELLSYAASHIRSSAHAEQLSRGGELITVVWLLMAHLGLGDHFELDPRTNGSDSES